MTEAEAKDLLDRYVQGRCTPSEQALVTEWLDAMGGRPGGEWTVESRPDWYARLDAAVSKGTGFDVRQNGGSNNVRLIGRWIWTAAAAAVLLSAGAYYWNRLAHDNKPITPSTLATDALPGGNKATLTLSNGRTVVLDSVHLGQLAQQQGASVIKKDSGALTYVAQSAHAEAVSYNTLTTPRGGQYHLQLTDGTEVWLNAASSIRYPTAFTGSAREVEVSGEAYFEVVKDKSKPFHVKVKGIDVEVLGTSFDVNAYADESAFRATLINGSVRIINATSAHTLNPGQQAVITGQAPVTVDNQVDLEAVMAWKNGRFKFDDTPLPDALRQLARWYDVEIEYKGDVSNKTVGGKMQRDLNLSEVLQGLHDIGVNFKIEGKKLIVMP